jgi:tRNA nucleotidyltransferase (CCA-adding enzyme)
VDFTLCRKDGFYSDGRRPDDVTSGTIGDDLARRDFTVNAISISVDGPQDDGSSLAYLFDPYEGVLDIEARMLRCVGNAEDRFDEDALRLLRAVRFHITKNFILHRDIIAALHDPETVMKLKNVSKERIYEELRKCFSHNSFEMLMFFRHYDVLEMFLFGFLEIGLQPTLQLPPLSKTRSSFQQILQ